MKFPSRLDADGSADGEATIAAIKPEDFFRQLELRRTRALVTRDMSVLEELHAPEYELVTPAGKVFSRSAYLEAIERGPFYAAWEVGKMAFRITGEMAIVRYKARLRFPSGRKVTCWHMDAYENRTGRWQAVWSQATELRPQASTPTADAATGIA